MTWRNILGRDVDWVALNGGKYRATDGLRRLFDCRKKWIGTNYHPTEMEYGDWYDLTLGEIANIGRREWMRQVGVGPVVSDLIALAIDMAAEGKPVVRGPIGVGPDSYVPKCERDAL